MLTRVFPPLDGDLSRFIGSMNMVIGQDKIVPQLDHGLMSGSGDRLHYGVTSIETKAPNGNPRNYFFVNTECWRFENGALTLDTTFADRVQGACVIDVGSSTERIIATFGDSAAVNGHYIRDLSTDTTPWTLNSGASNLTAFLIFASGAEVWAATGTAAQGRTTLGEHKIALCAPGVDARTAANWGAGEPVGMPDFPVVGIVGPVRDGMVAGKADGAYYRNDTSKRWEPITTQVKYTTHARNCKGMAAIENGVAIPFHDGTVLFYDGVNAKDISPGRGLRAGEDHRRGPITAIADRGDVVAMYEDSWSNYVKGARASEAIGLRVFTVIAGVGTEITAGVTDGSLVTPAAANMNAWGASAADRLIFVSSVPLEGLILRVTRNPNAANNAFTQPETMDGLGAFVSLGSIVDGTILGTATRSLVITGFPAGSSEAVLTWDGINGYDLAQPDTVTIPTIGAVANVYVYQFRPVNTTAMTTTTTIDEVCAIPARGGYAIDSTLDFSHRALAGAGVGRIFFGIRHGSSDFEWTEAANVYSLGGVWVMSWTTAETGTLSNGESALLWYGRFRQGILASSSIRDPSATPYARTVQATTTEPGPLLNVEDIDFRDEKGNLADPRAEKQLNAVWVNARYHQPVDQTHALVRWDEGRRWAEYAADHGSPLVMTNAAGGKGRRLGLQLFLEDASQNDPKPPEIREVWIDWGYAGTPWEMPKTPPFETPVLE